MDIEPGFTTVCWDIETTHLKADFGYCLCASVKPLGHPPITARIDDSPGYKSEPWNDKHVVCKIRDILNNADMLISWNGRRFDWKFLQTRLMMHGETPLQPALHIDVYYQSRYKLLLASNRLDHVDRFLHGDSEKTSLHGQIWQKAACGDRGSLDYVVEHCEKDVGVLERVFYDLKPFIKQIYRSG
jgi:uncharacterized protein YprB with RNaseH-like and TPR domain